jgi:glucose/arabinose dehydrogenase
MEKYMARLNWIKSLLATTMTMCVSGEALAQRYPAEIKTEDYTLKVDLITDQVKNPWSIAFIDAEHALITEKDGKLRLWAKGNLLPDPVSGTPVVNSSGQGGLLDVAIDPEYKTSGWIYLSYSHVQGDQPKGAAMTRIVRGKIKANAWTEQQVIFEAKPNHYRSGGVHFGCRIVFDKNGLLYFTIGERGNGNDAQDITKPNGKVHRINRDGSIPKDNPFVGKPDAYESIYTFGNRNQQGLTFLSDGSLWATEHGPQGGDELNLIRPGINYGWPVITYGEKYGGGQIGEGITEKEGMEQPVKQWTPSPALCGLDAVTGTMFPDWKDNLLVGALKFQEVKRVVIKDRKYAREEVIWKNAGRVRDVVTAPDGSICIVLNNRDGIVRLSKK